MSTKNPFLYGLLKSEKETFKLTKQRNSVGRNKNSQIIINHNTVSKDHAIIEFDEDYNATIKDLNSSNGTYVNGNKLKTIPLKLRTGDKIKFGKSEIEYIFESSNLLNDTKTEPELINELHQNSNNQIYDSIEMNQNNNNNNNMNFKDGKISLVNENELSYPKINHFQNKNHLMNDIYYNSNGMNFNTIRHKNFNNTNNLFYTNKKPILIEDNNNNNNNHNYINNQENDYINNNNININNNNNNTNNNDNNINNNINNNNNVNNNNNDDINNNNINNNSDNKILNTINNSNNNILMNSDYTFKNKMDEFERKIENLEKEKKDINNVLNEKINELKQMTNLFDELNEEYSKLNTKHNALMVYASDIQKKLDLSELELNEYKNKKYLYNEQELNKIFNQKDNMIFLLQNEINFYKELCTKNNLNTIYNNNDIYKNYQINNKLNTISDIFINENKQLKKKLEIYKNKINNIQKTNSNIINMNKKINNNINFAEFETQINHQIDNFNNIISDYNSKLSDAFNKITELFQNNNKEEAAKYLVEQINEYMLENQKLMAENAKLNTQILEYQSLLNKEHENILINNNKNKNINMNSLDLDTENNLNDYSEINLLKNKVGELENTIETIRQINYKTNPKYGDAKTNNNNDKLREAFVNVLNELKSKENIVQDLQNKLKDTIKRNNMNFDDNQAIDSISQKLKEKDNTIINLKNRIKSFGINGNFANEDSIKKIEEIRRKRQLFN